MAETKWAEYKRRQRRREKEAKLAEEDEKKTDEAHPVYPELRKYSDREYDGGGLVLKRQKCEKCEGEYAASVEILCPYCGGTGKRVRGLGGRWN